MTRAQAAASALRGGMGATVVSSVPATTHHASSLPGDASAGTVYGARTVNATVSACMGNATRQMDPAPANQATGANSAGNHVLLGSMDRTAGTSKEIGSVWFSNIALFNLITPVHTVQLGTGDQ